MFTPFDDNYDLDDLESQRIAVVHPTRDELPKNARGYAANNVYPGFPPLMNDGRALIASWQPEAVDNESLLKSSGVTSNWEYRKYLTKNAESIIKKNFEEAENDCGYYGFKRNGSNFSAMVSGIPKKHVSPAHYSSYLEREKDYGRFGSDLKANYLSREQLAARTVTPIITQSELFELQKNRSK
jgi:hypothetical protein